MLMVTYSFVDRPRGSVQERPKWRFGPIFYFCSKVPEFLHVGSYLVKEHRSVFFFGEFCFIFKKKRAEKRSRRCLFSFVQNRNKRKQLGSFVSWKSMKRYKAESIWITKVFIVKIHQILLLYNTQISFYLGYKHRSIQDSLDMFQPSTAIQSTC